MNPVIMHWLSVMSLISFILIIFIAIWNMAKSEIKDGKVIHEPKFFTFMEEGTGTAIMKAESLDNIIIASRQYYLEMVKVTRYKGTDREETITTWKIVSGQDDRWFISPMKWAEDTLGLYWIGIWPIYKRYTYKFSFTEWSEHPDEAGKNEIVYRAKDLTNFFFVKRFAYAFFLSSAEADGNARVNLRFSVFVRMVYPEIALFLNDQWLQQQLSPIVLRGARVYVGEMTFDNLKKEARHTDGDKKANEDNIKDFSEEIQELNGSPHNVRENLGIEIYGAQITEVDLAKGADKRLADAVTAEFVAEKEAKAKEIAGRGVRALYNAATSVPGGSEMYIAEQISKSNIDVLSLGGKKGVIPAITVDPNRDKKEDAGNGNDDKTRGGE